MKITLNGAKRSKKKMFLVRFVAVKVHIYSRQWNTWWRPDGNGYTNEIEEAGIYTFEDAWRRTCHCGPEKKIEFHSVYKPRS